MDNIDFGICMMLMVNSRIPYRKLAETFNMGVNSIHKRIKSMVDLGIIQNFNTKLNLFNFSSAINVVMFGRTKKGNKADLLQDLGNYESIFNVTQASGDLFYIHSHIKNISELNPLVSFVRQKGEFHDLEIGLISDSPTPNAPQSSKIIQESRTDNLEELGDNKLSNLDFLIINALKDNSRKSVTDISEEIGASTKTVKRHINRLEEKKLIDFSIDWYPDKSAVIISIIILKLNPSAKVDKSTLEIDLRKKYGQTILFSWKFANLPNLMLICVWTHTMKEHQEIESSLMSQDFDSVKITILVVGKMFPTWRDTYLEDKVRNIKNQLK